MRMEKFGLALQDFYGFRFGGGAIGPGFAKPLTLPLTLPLPVPLALIRTPALASLLFAGGETGVKAK